MSCDNGLASGLKACAGEGDPVSAAGKTAALVASAFPDAPAAETEILALSLFDLVLAIRLRWPRPVPLIATKILDPSLKSNARARPRPGDSAWANTAAGAIARAAAAALDLAGDLSRRADALLAVAPKLRAKPALKIVDLLLARLHLARRSRPPRADDRPRRPSAVRPAGRAWRRARIFGPARRSGSTAYDRRARRRQRSGDESLDVELADLPPAARWREWMLRVEAASSPRNALSHARRSSAWSAKPAGSTI